MKAFSFARLLDTIYEELLKDESLQLRPLVPYTTRPIRAGEMEGQEYHFTDRETLRRLEKAGRVIEERTYETVCGLWTYFTVDDGILEGDTDVIGIGTLQSYVRLRDYFGERDAAVLCPASRLLRGKAGDSAVYPGG